MVLKPIGQGARSSAVSRATTIRVHDEHQRRSIHLSSQKVPHVSIITRTRTRPRGGVVDHRKMFSRVKKRLVNHQGVKLTQKILKLHRLPSGRRRNARGAERMFFITFSCLPMCLEEVAILFRFLSLVPVRGPSLLAHSPPETRCREVEAVEQKSWRGFLRGGEARKGGQRGGALRVAR